MLPPSHLLYGMPKQKRYGYHPDGSRSIDVHLSRLSLPNAGNHFTTSLDFIKYF